jgi:hypothetical protein
VKKVDEEGTLYGYPYHYTHKRISGTRHLLTVKFKVADTELMVKGPAQVYDEIEKALHELAKKRNFDNVRDIHSEGQVNFTYRGVDFTITAYADKWGKFK